MLKTTDELQLKLTNLVDFYSQRNQNMLAWRNLYFMNDKVIWVDEEGSFIEPEVDEERIVSPIPYNMVEGFRELLLTKRPSISVPAPSVAGESLIHAEHNEKALLALWYQAGIYERLRDSLWHGLVDGWGVLQLYWDVAASKDESPIVVVHHDPYNVYPMPGDKPNTWKYVIHAYPRLIGQVKEEWWPTGDLRKRSNKVAKDAFDNLKDTDEVTFIDYWDDEINAVAISFTTEGDTYGSTRVETRWIKEPTKHNYGFLPWQIYMPNRLPFQNAGERMGVSILYVLEDVVKYLDKLLSQKATMLRRWQDPPLVTKTEEGPSFHPTRSERGMHLRLYTGESAEYLVHPGPMPQIDSMLQQVTEYIETSSLPRVLQGLYVGSVSGIAMSLLRNPTLMKIAFKQKEIERACVELNTKMLKLLEKKLGSPRYLWGEDRSGADIDIMLDPKRIGGYYRNEVKLSASLPADDANTVNMLLSLVQGKVISRQVARDVAQQSLHDLVPQSLIDEETRILAEEVLLDPSMVQTLARAAAEKVNLPYLPKQRNPKGGYGDKEITMPSRTLPSQTPGMPGGNTQPTQDQRISEMMSSAPVPTIGGSGG